MAAVFATTDQLDNWLEERHRLGLDTYDEWWEGTYRIVTGPTPEHGRLLNKLAVFLDPLAETAGFHSAAPINVGTDKFDCRVPDLGIYRPDTPRTSPAFLSTAVLVVEVLSPGERSLEKLGFYEGHGVQEYLEIDLGNGTVELWVVGDDGWEHTGSSLVLAFQVESSGRIVAEHGALDLKDFVK